MKSASLILMGVSVGSGIGAGVLLTLNMVVWAILTFWMGSITAFVGFVLIMWALRPRSSTAEAHADEAAPEPEPVTLPAQS